MNGAAQRALPGRRVALLGVLLAGASGCGPAPRPAPDAGGLPACAAEFCGAYRCEPRLGVCLTACGRTEDCVDGFSCEGGFCVGAECTAPSAAAACGPYACVLGRCTRDCSLGPCAAGYYCRGDTGACLPRCSVPFDPMCGGYACDVHAGECEPYCRSGELDCAPGYACSAGSTCESH